MIQQYFKQLFYFFPVLFCFCLPLGTVALSWIIILWGICSLFNISKTEIKKGLTNKYFWLVLFVFLITVISALFSKNKSVAAQSIEIKLSFVFIPYLFFCFSWPSQITKRCLAAFVSGCFFACVFLIIRGFYYYSIGLKSFLFYTDFSLLLHPSYFSMYLNLAFAMIIFFYFKWFKNQKNIKIFSWVMLIAFSITIFLCSSKMGIIVFVLTFPLILIFKFRTFFNFKWILFTFVVFALGSVMAIQFFPGRLQSITNLSFTNLDKTSSESTTVRVLIWRECLSLIRANFITGVGVGDVQSQLMTAYFAGGLSGAYKHNLNAHNQYFQSAIGLGMLGVIILLLLTAGNILKSFLKKHYLQIIFSIIITLNFLVESMLQTAAGTLFFVFFYCLLQNNSHQKLLNS
jgi:O-antigen ligase